ncbi:hypothetical protein GGR42_000472 [Saonia flava]|uniref:Uncharacterized protein n=1 Tax=Saonia flava TaxID=523696 RepID=A0A846QSS6_9FLAO|nr:hypothetical protein [Saonia flava]NJB70010.1 hypothetical protein [Saonia flava]
MKKIYIFTILSLFCLYVGIAQTEGITYQAVLIDNNSDEIPGVDIPSNNIPDRPISIRFTVMDASGNVNYQETQETQTDPYGTINLTIGQGQTTPESLGTFNTIDWDGPKTLKVDIDMDAGTNFVEFSEQSLTYVPYVRHRNLVADGVTNLNSDFNVNNQSLSRFTGDVYVEQDTRLQTLTADGASNFNNRVTITAQVSETNQSDIDAYPLRLQGSANGMAIQLNDAVPSRERNFVSFWNGGGEPIGRIEGFQAYTDVSQNFILDVIVDNEPSEDEAKDQDDDDTAPPAEAPSAFSVYLNNDYSLNLLLEYLDLIQSSASFGINLGACIAGVGIAGDCDDAVDAAFTLFIQGVQISLYIWYNEANVGVAFESGGADYAEWLKKYDAKETFTYGEVVGLRAGEISKSFVDADRFMVISKNPIVSGAMPKGEEVSQYKQVAFLGQVPVKVLGTVNKGDYILPSGNLDGMGIAVSPQNMRTNDYKRIIGVAWEEYYGNDLFSYINTAVGINTNDLVNVVSNMQQVMNRMQDALIAANPAYQPTYFDVETVTVDNNIKTTKSKTMQQLLMEQYGFEQQATTEQKLGKLKTIMQSKDVDNGVFKFSDMPYLQSVLENPTEENIKQYNDYYAKALENLTAMVQGR